MSQTEKSELYAKLKDAGVNFDKHYREYSTDDLQRGWDALVAKDAAKALAQVPTPDTEAAAFFGFDPPAEPKGDPEYEPVHRGVKMGKRDPEEMAGARLNTKNDNDVIRTDPETGRAWLQEEVLKPAYPKPRGRRVLRYNDPGVVTKTVKNGDYVETFEVAGDARNAQSTEVKITLPSYQVGIYRDPRFPFKVICYNGNEGFDREEVQKYYGGAELVPEECKRKYVENVLCYDMRTVIRAIQAEDRQNQLSRHPGLH